MIGKPEWFTYRIFGWGVRPKTKEGWIYLIVAILIALGISFMPVSQEYRMWVIGVFIAVLVADVLHIMMQLDKVHDERERMHQLIIERNCSFAALAALVGIVIYQAIINAGNAAPVDINILIVLGVMLFVKVASTIYVKSRM